MISISNTLGRFAAFVAIVSLLASSFPAGVMIASAEETIPDAPVVIEGDETPVDDVPADDTPVVDPDADKTAPAAEGDEGTDPDDSSDDTASSTEDKDIVSTAVEKVVEAAKAVVGAVFGSEVVLDMGDDGIATIATVELGVTYVAPQNDQVKVTFTSLPEIPGSLSIEEVFLSDEQVAALGALSNVAYDITSDMENGTFTYDLELPTPAGAESESKVVYAESLEDLEAEVIGEVASDKVEVNDEVVSVTELDHFTIFVVVPNDIIPGLLAYIPLIQGWRMEDYGNANIGLVAAADFGIPATFGFDVIKMDRIGGAGTNRAFLGYHEFDKELGDIENVKWNVYSKEGTDTYLNIYLRGGPLNLHTASVVFVPGTTIDAWQENSLADATSITVRHQRPLQSTIVTTYSSFADLMNSQYANWDLRIDVDAAASIAIVSGSSNPQLAQEHYVDGVTVDFEGQDEKFFNFTSTNDVPNLTIDVPAEGRVVSTKVNGNKLKVTGDFTDDVAVNYAQLELVYLGNLVTVYTMHYSDPGLAPDGSFTVDIPVASNLVDGEYSLFYTGTDFENGITARMERKFMIDNTKPVTTVISPASGGVYETDALPAVLANSTDGGSGLVQLTMNLYGPSGLIKSCVNEPLAPASASKDFSCDLSTLSAYLTDDGDYHLKVNSKDAVGNVSNTVTWNFTIDNGSNPPVVTIESPTPAENAVVSGLITGHAVATDDEGMGSYYLRFWKGAFESGIDNLVVNCQFAPGGKALGTDEDATCDFDSTQFPDGVYVFSAQFQDDDIQWGQALRTFVVDNTPPDVPVHESPADNSSQNVNDFYFEWTDVNGAVEYEFQSSQNPAVDGNGVLTTGVWNNKAHGNSNQDFLTDSKIHSVGANGTWYWQVRAIDEAGNKSAWTTPWKMTIDMVAPAVPTGLGWNDSNNGSVPDGGETDLVSGTAVWDANTETDLSHYIYKYWNDISTSAYNGEANAWVANNIGSNSLPGVFNQGEGTHHFCVIAVDQAGNQSACSDDFTVIYETNPVIPPPPTFTFGDTTVMASAMNGWEFNRDRTTWTMGPTGFVEGPATAPLGLGSAMIGTATNDDRTKLRMYIAADIALSNITALAYDTYRTGTSTGTVTAPALQLDVRFTHNAALKTGRIVYEPYFNGTVENDVWQSWDALAGKWWIAGVGGLTECTQSHATACTWAELQLHYPDMVTSPVSLENIDGQGAVLFKAGGAWGDFTGYVDEFVMGIKTGNNTHTETYDFEPEVVTPQAPAVETSSRSSSSGGRSNISAALPQAQVLGASTDDGDFCVDPFIVQNLAIGWTNPSDQVTRLQNFLNGNLSLSLPVTGIFGELTRQAVMTFQSKYAADILAPWGISNPTGMVYHTTKKKINELVCEGQREFPLTPEQQREIDENRSNPSASTGPVGSTAPAPSVAGATTNVNTATNTTDEPEEVEEMVETSQPEVKEPGFFKKFWNKVFGN